MTLKHSDFYQVKEKKSHRFNVISLWVRRSIIYISLYILVVIITLFISKYLSWPLTDVNSARYMLSALVQSEAAIVAIVITLSLIAVQLAAQSYSTRVIDIFKNNPDLQILTGIYVGAIIYGLSVLKLMDKPNQLENHILSSYSLGIFVLLSLAPYIWNTFNFLKPSTIINSLSEKISCETILYAIEEDNEKIDDVDPIQPIIDIVRSSLMKYDYETVKMGLTAIENRMDFIIEDKHYVGDERIVKHFFNHLLRVGKLAILRDNDDSALQVLMILKKICLISLQKNFDFILQPPASFFHFGKLAAEKKYEGTTIQIIYILEEMVKEALKKNISDITFLVDQIAEIGKIATYQSLPNAIKITSISFEEICEISINQNRNDVISNILFKLTDLGMVTAGNNLDKSTCQILKSLENIESLIAGKEFEMEIASQIVESLGRIGEKASENELKDAMEQAIESITNIGLKTAENKFEATTAKASEFLGIIGKISAEKRLKPFTIQTVESLSGIKMEIVLKEIRGAIYPTIEAIEMIGIEAIENKIENAAELALETLYEFGIDLTNINFEDSIISVAESIHLIGMTALDQKNKDKTQLVMDHLDDIGTKAQENKLKDAEDEIIILIDEISMRFYELFG